jgi:hypothetical protein
VRELLEFIRTSKRGISGPHHYRAGADEEDEESKAAA